MARATFLQNIMTGETTEFPSFDEAFDFQIARNRGDEHWSLYQARPEPIAPMSAAPFVMEAIEGPGIGTFERMDIIQREIGRQQLAALDVSLSEIASRSDITQFLEAAE